MGLTFTVQPQGQAAEVFAVLAPGAGKFCLNFNKGAPLYDLKRYHIAGTKGNVTVRDGHSACMFHLQMLYAYTTDALAYSALCLTQDLWAWNPLKLTDPSAAVWDNCNLVPGSFRIIRWGTDGRGYAEVAAECQLTWDGAN